ncbi:non ribosomal peptide synthase [Rhodotorula toruloides ATCC 204091]|uniref:Non ribosomal peptide synthase n=1 Tax=Rhodotorula toruloides TaxID=5286 RepID=A0A0K3CQD1_RHOTO|nr:non ribosomal peptide synthase [Rhodotorula toruloides ATCC 204091]PRQ70220.1 non ribosomal peptide synthase [Rhodotorula toruloides]
MYGRKRGRRTKPSHACWLSSLALPKACSPFASVVKNSRTRLLQSESMLHEMSKDTPNGLRNPVVPIVGAYPWNGDATD